MKKLQFLTFSILLSFLTNCSSSDEITNENDNNNDNNPITPNSEKLYANIGNERLVEINLSDGSETLILNFQNGGNNDSLDQMYFLNDEFIGTRNEGGETIIKKINPSTGEFTSLTTINNYVDLIPSTNGKLYANIGNERLVEINLSDGSETLILNFQNGGNNDSLDQMYFLNDEFIGTRNGGGETIIKKINPSTGEFTSLTTIDNYVDLIFSKSEKLHANIGNERLVEINLSDGSETLILNFQSDGNNSSPSNMFYLNNEFIGVQYAGNGTIIKKINPSTGEFTSLTTIDDDVDLIY